MKFILLFALLFIVPKSWSQDTPTDIFLEAPAESTPPIEDKPPDEPPYTKTQDELEAQQLLPTENQPESKKSPKKEIVETEVGENGKKKIAHPNAKKGLYLIDQNTGRYYYKTTKLSHKNQATSIRFGTISAPNITTDIGAANPVTFTDIYKSENIPYLILDYEWQPFQSFGKLGVVLGMGFFTASGKGRFANPTIKEGADAKEGFTFIGLPISGGGIYRLEFSDKQWLAPFVVGGLSYYVLGELRDDGKKPKIVGTPAAYGGGGIMFNITAWDKEIDFTMDREYGISNMWLTAEFRTVHSLNEDLDVSSDIINFGISVDY